MTAQQEYQQNYKEVQGLILSLQDKLEKHKQKASDNPKNWGFVGDIEQVKYLLSQANDYFGSAY